ncbi:MAG TPA: hypothetical protein EYG38_08880 [Verrucomicrobia bacterium]|nr:hypothetical protein [Verrucomicrobiota bacterium]
MGIEIPQDYLGSGDDQCRSIGGEFHDIPRTVRTQTFAGLSLKIPQPIFVPIEEQGYLILVGGGYPKQKIKRNFNS